MLYVIRKITLGEFVYKTLHNLSPPVESRFFMRQITQYNMRDKSKLVKPPYNTIKYGMKSIVYQGASVWNDLPVQIKEVDEYANFRQLLRNSNYWNN